MEKLFLKRLGDNELSSKPIKFYLNLVIRDDTNKASISAKSIATVCFFSKLVSTTEVPIMVSNFFLEELKKCISTRNNDLLFSLMLSPIIDDQVKSHSSIGIPISPASVILSPNQVTEIIIPDGSMNRVCKKMLSSGILLTKEEREKLRNPEKMVKDFSCDFDNYDPSILDNILDALKERWDEYVKEYIRDSITSPEH